MEFQLARNRINVPKQQADQYLLFIRELPFSDVEFDPKYLQLSIQKHEKKETS